MRPYWELRRVRGELRSSRQGEPFPRCRPLRGGPPWQRGRVPAVPRASERGTGARRQSTAPDSPGGKRLVSLSYPDGRGILEHPTLIKGEAELPV